MGHWTEPDSGLGYRVCLIPPLATLDISPFLHPPRLSLDHLWLDDWTLTVTRVSELIISAPQEVTPLVCFVWLCGAKRLIVCSLTEPKRRHRPATLGTYRSQGYCVWVYVCARVWVGPHCLFFSYVICRFVMRSWSAWSESEIATSYLLLLLFYPVKRVLSLHIGIYSYFTRCLHIYTSLITYLLP